MPCSYYDPNEVTTDRRDLERLHNCEAILCSIVRLHGLEHVHKSVDAKCGVSADWITKWWSDHEKADSKRIAREIEKHRTKLKRLEDVITETQAKLRKLKK